MNRKHRYRHTRTTKKVMLKYLSRIQQTVAFISAKSVTCVSLATNVRGKALPLWARSGLAAAQRVELKRVPEAAIRETQKFHPFQRRSQILGHSAVGSGRTTAWTGRTALSPICRFSAAERKSALQNYDVVIKRVRTKVDLNVLTMLVSLESFSSRVA